MLCSRAVQPRGYGEHERPPLPENIYIGSAPWVRGTLHSAEYAVKYERFSPVGTGNTKYKELPEVCKSVQPRGYGEHILIAVITQAITGSAPWVRGTLFAT